MNNSNACADNSARSNEIARLVELTNQKSFNWFPLAELFTKEVEPKELETDLTQLYFEITELIVDNLDKGSVGLTANHLWRLRQVIEATKATQSNEAPQISLAVNDNIKFDTNHSASNERQEADKLMERYLELIEAKDTLIEALQKRISLFEQIEKTK